MAIEEIKPEDVPAEMQEAFEAAKARDAELFVLHGKETGITVICKRVSRPVYRKFREEREGRDAATRSSAFENLFLASLVVPSPKEFEPTLNRMPALADAFGMALWDRVLGTDAISTKKA